MSGTHTPGSAGCRELFEKLSEYLDGELDASTCESVGSHLADCRPCVEFLESLRRTVDLLHRLPGATLPDEARREIVEAYARLKAGS